MKRLLLLPFFLLFLVPTATWCGVYTTPNNFDPQPLYSAHFPNSFLTTRQRLHAQGIYEQPYTDRVNFSIMPFYEQANKGTDIFGNHNAPLGDLAGRMNMLALLPYNVARDTTLPCPSFTAVNPYTNTFADIPCGDTPVPLLVNIRDTLLTDICTIWNTPAPAPGPLPSYFQTVQGLLELQQATTTYTQKNIGEMITNIKYRKYGARFNWEFYLCKGIGFVFSGGFASITQAPTYTDTTQGAQNITFPFTPGSAGAPTVAQWTSVLSSISRDLMAQTALIGETLNQRINTFDGTSVEDLNLDGFWRALFRVQDRPHIIPGQAPHTYTSYILMPYISVGGTIAIAKLQDYTRIMSLPFGNNGHNALRGRGGISLDFYGTCEVFGEFGLTKFFKKTFAALPMPSNQYQSVMYPYTATTTVHPGKNLHIALGLCAYNFISVVSATVAYVYVHHDRNIYTLVSPTQINATNTNPTNFTAQQCNPTAFSPELLRDRSGWSVHVLNLGLSWDLSPHARGCAIVQIPIARRNAYRTSTWGVSIEARY